MTYLVLSPHTQPRRFTLSNEEQSEGWAGDVFGTFTTHTSLVYDVTNTDCRAQNGCTHGRVFAIFKRRCLTNAKRKRLKTAVCIEEEEEQEAQEEEEEQQQQQRQQEQQQQEQQEQDHSYR